MSFYVITFKRLRHLLLDKALFYFDNDYYYTRMNPFLFSFVVRVDGSDYGDTQAVTIVTGSQI
jgi:hypothetical protein